LGILDLRKLAERVVGSVFVVFKHPPVGSFANVEASKQVLIE